MSTGQRQIQRVELCCEELTLHCPFCGSVVFDTEPIHEDWKTPCAHTLFVADDNHLFHRSVRFDGLMQIEGVQTKDVDFGDDYTDGFTDKVFCSGSVKFAIYLFGRSGFGIYVGFAPAEADIIA